MARPKPTEEDLATRETRRAEWKQFRKEYLFTQVRLAEVLGISRRTVQLIERGSVTPLARTLHRFKTLLAKYKNEEAA